MAMAEGLIVTASGEAYNPPLILNEEEFDLVLRCFGMNRRRAVRTRNRWIVGTVKSLMPDAKKDDLGKVIEEIPHPKCELVNSMAKQGIIAMYLDAIRVKKAGSWNGDLSKVDLAVSVTQFGGRCFEATIKAAADARQRAKNAVEGKA